MKIIFKEGDAPAIVEKIKAQLAGRKLGEMVSFSLNGKDLEVTIKKLGTSSLKFTDESKNGSIQWNLTSEKIAFAHKAFKDDVLEKITKVVNQVGGSVSA